MMESGEIGCLTTAMFSAPRADISRTTNGQVGGYLTYIYSLHRLVIVNVKEFDGLTPAAFRKHIPGIKRALKPYNGKVTVKQAKVTVI